MWAGDNILWELRGLGANTETADRLELECRAFSQTSTTDHLTGKTACRTPYRAVCSPHSWSRPTSHGYT
jgi:hypothetical protein